MIKYCDCECHEKDSTIIHCVACCDLCSKCGKGIWVGFKEHFESCTGELLKNVKRKKKAGYKE